MQQRRWTKEEESFLEERWGSVSITAIAKSLDRNVNSIKGKAARMKLGNFIENGDYITFTELLEILGVKPNYSYMKMRLIRDGFPIKHKTIVTKKISVVYIKDFWSWTEKNKQKISFAKFERGALGKEPKWAEEKRIADMSSPSKISHNRLWTKSEINKMIFMCKAGRYTYKDIADELNRTQAAIKRKLYELKVPYRPLYLDNHVKWTEEENNRMIDLYNKGYDCYSISKALGKTNLSISDRLRKMGVV